MIFSNNPGSEALKAVRDMILVPYWLDDPTRPAPVPGLEKTTTADLVVIGGGFTGLWTALLTKEANPVRDVVLLEGGLVGQGASGRNGGFVAASLTHGLENGRSRWPGEMNTLVRLGYENLEAIADAVRRYTIDCDFIRSGELLVATEPYQVEDLRGFPAAAAIYGEELTWLEQNELQAMVNSPIYLGGVYNSHGVAMVNPARLAWGLRRACLEQGVRLYENTPVTHLEEQGSAVAAFTPHGVVKARQAALASNAYPALLKRLGYYIVPVYDYALMTEPLSVAQRAKIGWSGRQGISDCANQFHYYRMTQDGRILWGGYDAVYYRGNGFGPEYEQNMATFQKLAGHFFQTFPQLSGLRFSHGWGGAIDTCSRFCVFWDTLHHGRTAYAAGFTGLGVGASRFGAQVMLDLLAKLDTPRTRLKMVRSKPIPFPPEPLRAPIIRLTQASLNQADANQGRRNLWLRVLDALGLGFDS